MLPEGQVAASGGEDLAEVTGHRGRRCAPFQIVNNAARCRRYGKSTKISAGEVTSALSSLF